MTYAMIKVTILDLKNILIEWKLKINLSTYSS